MINMRKKNLFFKNLKNINYLINNLLEKNLNKLKFNNLSNLARSNKIILSFVALVFISITYLLLPSFYNKNELSNKFKKELVENLNLNFTFQSKLNYNFFPRPHFTTKKAIINYRQKNISIIEKLKIYISLENLFSLKKIQIDDVVIQDANFNFDKSNYNFFIELLNNNFLKKDLRVENSNIFFENNNEILFINKILKMKYSYDLRELKNIMNSKNELFNVPYEIQIFNDEKNKKFISKLNLDALKLQLDSVYNYNNEVKNGMIDIISNKSKSIINYKINKKFLEFDYLDKFENPKFLYKGTLNLNPFYSIYEGKVKQLNISTFFDSNSLITQLLKTEILNSKNIDFRLNILADNIKNSVLFEKLNFYSKIEDGLIDLDNTRFEWNNSANFKIYNSLIYVKNGELIIDGNLKINIDDYNEIYKFLLTPKNYRQKVKNVEANFSYNIDQKTIKLTDIRIENQYYQDVNKILESINFKDNNLQNKIYFKNLLNEAIKSYAG